MRQLRFNDVSAHSSKTEQASEIIKSTIGAEPRCGRKKKPSIYVAIQGHSKQKAGYRT